MLRICGRDKLAAPKVKKEVKKRLCELWSFTFASLSSGRLSADAPEALMAVRWYRLPQMTKRAIFELMRSPEALDDILGSKYPREWFLSDTDTRRLWRYREVLGEEWRAFVMHSPIAEYRPCPTYGAASPCSAARQRLAAVWAVAVGEPMVEGEYRYDPLGGLHALCSKDWRSFGLCLGCAKGMVQLCWKKQEEWFGKFETWINPETWCVDGGEVEPDADDNMPYVDSDDEPEGMEAQEEAKV